MDAGPPASSIDSASSALAAGRLALEDAGAAARRRRLVTADPERVGDLPRQRARRHRLRRGPARAVHRARHPAPWPRTWPWPCSAARRRPTSGSPSTFAGRSCRPPTRAHPARSRWARHCARFATGRSMRPSPAAPRCPLSPLAFGAFDIIRALSSGSQRRTRSRPPPFDAARDGFVLGEGAALLVLEAAEVARASRCRRPMPSCWATAPPPTRTTWSSPDPTVARPPARSRSRSTDAGVSPEEIDYVNAHASRPRSATSPRPARSRSRSTVERRPCQ